MNKTVEDFKKIARKHGMKITPQRVAIYKELISRYDHPSAEDIYEALKGNYEGISLATVYRTLTNLEKTGLAIKVATVNGIARFDGNITPHSHFICKKCGKIIDINCKPDIDLSPVKKYNLHVDKCEIIYHGLCDKCQN